MRAVGRWVLNLRLVAVVLTVAWVPYTGDARALVSAALVAAALVTLVPLLCWDRLVDTLMRHPLLVLGDLVLGTATLAVLGPTSPFLYYTVGTAVLAGVLYRWAGAALFSGLLLAAYGWALTLHVELAAERVEFLTLVGLPALYPLGAAAGAALHTLLVEKRAVERALDERTRLAAAAEERSRLAREMHDSLAKTVNGIALSAVALPTWIERSPQRAVAEAHGLARSAECAASEARDLIGDLRADTLEKPLDRAIAASVRAWSARTDTPVSLEVVELERATTPGTRYELFAILREALANVEEHARATWVGVRLGRDDDQLMLDVDDDGIGFAPPPEADAFAHHGHYGLIGMRERAQRVGGDLQVVSAPGAGCTITARVPTEQRRSYVSDETPEVAPSSA